MSGNCSKILGGGVIMEIRHYAAFALCIAGIVCFTGNAFCNENGKTVYKKRCTVCHLVKSEGAPVSAYHAQFRPLDFTTSPALKNLSEEKLHRVLTRGQGVMKPVKLSADDYKALVDYLINDLKKKEESAKTK